MCVVEEDWKKVYQQATRTLEEKKTVFPQTFRLPDSTESTPLLLTQTGNPVDTQPTTSYGHYPCVSHDIESGEVHSNRGIFTCCIPPASIEYINLNQDECMVPTETNGKNSLVTLEIS